MHNNSLSMSCMPLQILSLGKMWTWLFTGRSDQHVQAQAPRQLDIMYSHTKEGEMDMR